MYSQTLKKIIFAGLFLLPFIPFLVFGSLFFPFITSKAFAFRIIVEIIFGAWVILALIAKEYRPKHSPILIAIGVFLLVVGVANLFGMEPVKSFWSNFERMEGYITMLHLGALFLVTSNVFKAREWKWWWNTTLVASLLMIIYSTFQLLGAIEINQGGARVDGTLGNAAYLALYFLIHIFVSIYYFAKSKTSGLRWTYGLLIFGQVAILYFTATRGAIIGLLGGLVVIALLNITNKDDLRIRKWSRGLLVALVVLLIGFISIRETSFVQNSQTLNRFANLNISSLKTEGRAFIWPMAIEGIKERPILGWGQENFNYVFAKHYQAEMFRLEPWFDRAHNIFLDWGISAGLLGLGAYLSLYIVFLYSLWRKSALSRVEKSVLTGLISAYFFNNFFVFDNLVSYILFFSLLAYVHSEMEVEEVDSRNTDESRAVSYGVPVLIATLIIVYFVNIKPIIANTSLIRGLQVTQTEGLDKRIAIDSFKKAYESSRLGRPETVEWISNFAPNILGDTSLSLDVRNEYYAFAQKAVLSMAEELFGDPRYEIMGGVFFHGVGQVDKAIASFERALALMPEKQHIYFNLSQSYIQKGDFDKALSYLKTAYELAPDYPEARFVYAIGAIYAGDRVLEEELKEATYAGDRELEAEFKSKGLEETDLDSWVSEDRIIMAYERVGRFGDIVEFLNRRLKRDPEVAQNYVSLAATYLKLGESSRAIQTLRMMSELMPQYESQVEGYIKQIQEGKGI